MASNWKGFHKVFRGVITAAFVLATSLLSAAELTPSDEPVNHTAMPEESKDLIWAFMRELELPNPFEQPKPRPAPRPSPAPSPTPSPTPTPQPSPPSFEDDDDFLWEEDDFMTSDKGFDDWQAEFDRQYKAIKAKWDKRLEERYKIWRAPSADFLSFKDAVLKQTLESAAVLNAGSLSYSSSRLKSVENMAPGDFHVVPQSLSIPVRSQAYRGTCVAFAFTRAMESVFNSYSKVVDLSENHFYWLAKDQCREPGACACTQEQRDMPDSPCESDGMPLSQPMAVFSSNSEELFVVPESECEYNPRPYPRELTGAPLPSCQPFDQPVAKPLRLRELKTHPEIIDSILNNKPVVIGVAVTEGMGKSSSRNNQQSLGQVVNRAAGDKFDAGGHAMTVIGIIKLDPKDLASEGRYCLITANSWGTKFGANGHSCFTEKWAHQFLTSAVAVDSLDVKQEFFPKVVY